MSKWDSVRSTFKRAHESLFDSRYNAEFVNYSGGSWSPTDDDFSGESEASVGSANVEIVPPAIDASVDNDGTSVSFDTSIRLPEDDAPVSEFVVLGEDNDRPTEVEITDRQDGSTETYELHGYKNELGSGMIMCRLVES